MIPVSSKQHSEDWVVKSSKTWSWKWTKTWVAHIAVFSYVESMTIQSHVNWRIGISCCYKGTWNVIIVLHNRNKSVVGILVPYGCSSVHQGFQLLLVDIVISWLRRGVWHGDKLIGACLCHWNMGLHTIGIQYAFQLWGYIRGSWICVCSYGSHTLLYLYRKFSSSIIAYGKGMMYVILFLLCTR